MHANYVQRLRLTITKIGPTRFISHLDLARTLERSLNRAQIPMAYTQGFNRRPRMAMATALPLGYTSECELVDIWLTDAMEPAAAREQMMLRMAPGIEVRQVADVPLAAPALQMATVAATYTATLLDPVDTAELQARIDAMISAETLVRERQKGHEGKILVYDLRPLIHTLGFRTLDDDVVVVEMMLSLMPSFTGRPDEVLLALGLDPLAARVHRTQMILGETDAVRS